MIEEDLKYIIKNTKDILSFFRGKKIFITGGTGFFGVWLVEFLVYANKILSLNMQISVLTRNKENYFRKMPCFLKYESLKYIEGDVRSFRYLGNSYDVVIHAATDTSLTHKKEKSLYNFDVITSGTKNVLDFAVASGVQDVVLISSGAVYGEQPRELKKISESFSGAPCTNDIKSVYGEGKRVTELLGLLYSENYNINVKIARCFSFIGPYMDLNNGFAIGDFIKNFVNDDTIVINGDGTPYRSYLYMSDMVIWLLTILVRGDNCTPYNIGSEHAVSIKELAVMVSKIDNKNLPIQILEKKSDESLPRRYIPSVEKAYDELGLRQRIDLNDMIIKTIRWAEKI